MEHKKVSVDQKFEKFIWKIENFSHFINVSKIYSEPFIVGGYPWRIGLNPKGTTGSKYSSIYLEAMQTANMSYGWRRNVKLNLLVFNQLDTNKTITQEINHEFHASSREKSMEYFIRLSDLQDHQKGFLVKDACIVGAEFSVCKSTLEKPVNQAASLTYSLACGSQNGHMKVEDPNFETISPVSTHIDAELFSPSIEELMDFITIGQLQKVHSDIPPLIERPRNTSQKLTDLAFAALGRVLYFLKNIKVKDINDKACKDLEVLWDELKKFKFDVTWLEPQVQHALGMKSYVEKVMQVENLKDNMVLLELEKERLEAKLVAAKVNVDIERDSLKAKGIKERDLDSEFGVWKP